MNKEEIWKDVPNYEGYYQASNKGNVRSLDRHVIYSDGQRHFYKGELLRGNMNGGYKRASLNKGGVSYNPSFAQVVAMTFLGHKPDGHKIVVDHINGDKLDDRVENLRLVTTRANTTTCFRKNRDSLTSKYIGVSWDAKESVWRSVIKYKGKNVYLGIFRNEIDASNAYQNALKKINNGSFNTEDYRPKYSSKYNGVHFNKDAKTWTGRASVDGGRVYVGQFQTEIEAYNAIVDYKLNK